jgi:hypothetical protein
VKHLTRTLLALLVVAFLVSPAPANAQAAPAWGPITKSLSAVGGTTTGAGSAVLSTSSTAVMFHVYSASTSTATVTIEQSVDGVAWYTSATITNPSSVGELWTCPAAGNARLNLTAHSAGTITGVIRQRNVVADPVAVGCKKIDAWTGFTFPGSTGTFNITGGKTAAITGSLTFAGTDSTTMTFPTTSVTVARTDNANTFTGTQTVSSIITANKFIGLGTAPTVTGSSSTCGTTAGAIAGKDSGGTVTVGSVGGTVCVVTFGTAFANAPACVVTSGTAVNVKAATTTTTLTVTATFAAGEIFNYVCLGY